MNPQPTSFGSPPEETQATNLCNLTHYLVLVDFESGKHELSNTENLIGQQVRYTHRVAKFNFIYAWVQILSVTNIAHNK
jgi:hypothetical protein